MCQILGMNCAAPTDFSFSLKGFCRRGGDTDKHSHGFGLCVYQGRGVRSFHDTLPACQSPIAELVQQYPIRTYNMLAHIRYATQGCVSLENVHPFVRVWKGIQMTFCHNGDCPKFTNHNHHNSSSNTNNTNNTPPLLGKTRPGDVIYHPVGDTDSEAVFCAILNALSAEFPQDELPTLTVLHEFLAVLCDQIIASHSTTSTTTTTGTDDNDDDDDDDDSTTTHEDDNNSQIIFNFLLGCGQYTMFAYSWPGQRPGSSVWNGLHYIIRQPPFSTAKLLDVDYTIDFSQYTTAADRVAVITTKPLTQEAGWTEFRRGELILFDKGVPYTNSADCEAIEQQGRGLSSRSFSTKCRESPTVVSVRRQPSMAAARKCPMMKQPPENDCDCDSSSSSSVSSSDHDDKTATTTTTTAVSPTHPTAVTTSVPNNVLSVAAATILMENNTTTVTMEQETTRSALERSLPKQLAI